MTVQISGKGVRGALGLLVLAAALTGCASTAGIEATGKRGWTQEGAPALDTRIDINNRSLAADIEVVDVKSFMAGDLMRAQATLRSRDRETLPIQYRFVWFDREGMELGGQSVSWKPLVIHGREHKTVSGVAPDPRGREFQLKIRASQE